MSRVSSPTSFFSSASHKNEPTDTTPTAAASEGEPNAYPPDGNNMTQTNKVNLEDVDAWLAHPENLAILHKLADKTERRPNLKRPSPGSEPALMSGVGNTSQEIADLFMTCQKKGLDVRYDLHELTSQRFTGELIIGGTGPSAAPPQTIRLTNGMKSKREAKAWLAVQARPIVECMSAQARSAGAMPGDMANGPNQAGSQAISDFYQACQLKGITPVYNIEEIASQRFTGTLTIGSRTLSLSTAVRSKKEARTYLAQQALPTLANLPSTPKGASGGDKGGENWVGKFQEFINTLSVPPKIIDWAFTQPHGVGGKFGCLLTVDPPPFQSAPGVPWVTSNMDWHTTKKAAKADAAAEAIGELACKGLVAPDGSVLTARGTKISAGKGSGGRRAMQLSSPAQTSPSAGYNGQGSAHGYRSPNNAYANTGTYPHPQTLQPGASTQQYAQAQNTYQTSPYTYHPALQPAVQSQPSAPKPPTPPTAPTGFSQRVAVLAAELGLAPPSYRFQVRDPSNPSLFSCAAYFPSEALKINEVVSWNGGPLGEVRDVYSRKKAQEECARGVFAYLEALRAGRVGDLGLE